MFFYLKTYTVTRNTSMLRMCGSHPAPPSTSPRASGGVPSGRTYGNSLLSWGKDDVRNDNQSLWLRDIISSSRNRRIISKGVLLCPVNSRPCTAFLSEVWNDPICFIILCPCLAVYLFKCPPFPLGVRWKWKSLSRVPLFATPRTIQSMEFSRLEYWSG